MEVLAKLIINAMITTPSAIMLLTTTDIILNLGHPERMYVCAKVVLNIKKFQVVSINDLLVHMNVGASLLLTVSDCTLNSD